MDVSEAIDSRIEIRTFRDSAVPREVQRTVLEAGRLAPSGRNLQHWRFVLVESADRLTELAEASPTGRWIGDAAFAVAVCTDPGHSFHEFDAGRAVTHMQLQAWEHGVGSCVYTVDTPEARSVLEIPDGYALTVVAGFGYPATQVEGRKNRLPLSAVAYRETFGSPIA